MIVQMIGLTSRGGDRTARPATLAAVDGFGVSCHTGKGSGGVDVNADSLGVANDSADLVLRGVGGRFGRVQRGQGVLARTVAWVDRRP